MKPRFILSMFATASGSLALILTLHLSLASDPASAQSNAGAASSRGVFNFNRSSVRMSAGAISSAPAAVTNDLDRDNIPDYADWDDDNDGIPDDQDTPELDAAPGSKGYPPVIPQELPSTGGGFRAHSAQ